MLGIAIATAYTLFDLSDTRTEAIDPWTLLPTEATVILEFPDPEKAWNELANQSRVWKALRAHNAFEDAHRFLECAFSAPQKVSAAEQFKHLPILIAIDEANHEEPAFLVILSAQEEIDRGKIIDLAGCLDPDWIKDLQQTEGGEYTLELDTLFSDLFVQIGKNNLRISNRKTLLEPTDSIGKYTELRKWLGKGADAHAIIDTKKAEGFFDFLTRDDYKGTLELPSGLLALDLVIRPEQILANGILSGALDSSSFALGQVNQDVRSEQFVSDDACLIYSTYSTDLMAWSERFIARESQLEASLNMASDTLLIDLQRVLCESLNGDLTLAGDCQQTDKRWILATSNDIASTWAAYESLQDAYTNAGRAVQSQRNTERLILGFPESLPVAMLGKPFSQVEAKYVGISGDLIVFAEDRQTILKALNAYDRENTLTNLARTQSQFNEIPHERKNLFWMDIARSKKLLNEYFEIEKTGSDTSAFDQLGAFSFRLEQDMEGFQRVGMHLSYSPVSKDLTPDYEWSLPLPTYAKRKPDILKDHSTRGKSILIQDDENVIHYVSGSGEEKWSRKLGEPILGQVHQVDRYHNGKYQMLFNTASNIHLIDIKGNDVEGYPISLDNKTLAPLALIKYDDKSDYRIIASDQEGSLLNFDLTGAAIDWSPITLIMPTTLAVEHIRVRTKDYLMVLLTDGTMHLLDRQGRVRFEPKISLNGIGRNTTYVVERALDISKCRITWNDTTGKVWQGEFGGSVQPIMEFSNATIRLCHLDDDGIIDALASTRDSLFIRSSEHGTASVSVSSPLSIHLYSFSAKDKRIGVASNDYEGVMLYTVHGEAINGFPMEGSAPFSIADLDADGDLELLVLTESNELVSRRIP